MDVSDKHPLQQLFLELVGRHYAEEIGIRDPQVVNYVAQLLSEFCDAEQLLKIRNATGRPLHDVGEMLIVEVELPEQEGFERRCIRCQTTVARVHAEPGATFTWVGLRIHAMDFRVAQGAPARYEAASYNGRGSRVF